MSELSIKLKSAFDAKANVADLEGKVDKVDGKGLSTNDYTTADKTKLDGIEEGAEKNPTDYVHDNDSRLTDARPASDVQSWAKASTKPTYSASEITYGETNVGSKLDSIVQDTDEFARNLGEIADLETTATTIVGAINELKSSASQGGGLAIEGDTIVIDDVNNDISIQDDLLII